MDRTKRTYPRRLLSLLLAWLLCISCVQPAFAASETAKTVQLMKTEGTVSVTSNGGKSVSLRDSMRLYNGYQVATNKASYAWFNLDSSKLSKLDEVSKMELRKSGKKLELLLNSGNLFFNVTEPLEEDETLNIRTSTMVVGIRGTCGWVEVIDQWHSRVRVLEGRVTCSVTDPVTGQTKTTVLTGGEWAECVVYPQDRSGDKCDIIRQRFTEEDIPGFVLVELAGDGPLCEKIYADSGLDLRNLTHAQALEKLRADQAEMAEKLGDSQRAQEVQERNVSTDPVWTPEEPSAGTGNGGRREPADTDVPATPETPASGITSTTPITTQALTMTMPVTIPQIQAALNPANVSSVTVLPDPTGANNDLIQNAGEPLNVAAGKTLTLNAPINLETNDQTTVDGTMRVNGDLTNNGTIIVTSPNSLHVTGRFINNGTVDNRVSGHIEAAQGITNNGAIHTSGNAVLESSAAATVTMAGAGASLSLNGGSISNTGAGNALRWENGESPSTYITATSTTNIWTTGDAPLAVVIDGIEQKNPALDGYKVVTNEGQTSLRPTGGVEGGVIVDPVTVSFDANGGRWSGTAPSITVERGQPMGAVSQAPTREDYTFLDWRDANDVLYTESSIVNGDITLYARWQYTGSPENPEEETVTVTFMNEGEVYASITIEKGGSLPYLPAAPERTGYAFTGWSGLRDAYDEDATITAQWQRVEPEENEVTITFMNEGAAYASITIEKGGSLPYLPAAPERTGYAFTGWSGLRDTYDEDATITAQWQRVEPEENEVTITFINEGAAYASITIEKGGSLPYLPAAPERTGYAFTGWSGLRDVYNEDATITAQWQYIEPEENEVTITFMNEGAVYASITIEKGGALPYLPAAPERTGYTFTGWSGLRDAYDEDATITAQWQEDSGTETVTVTFHASSPVDDTEPEESFELLLQKGQALNYPPMIPVYNGYQVTQWTETPDADGDEYYDAWDQGVESDLELYAVWEKIELEDPGITITYDANGGTFSSSGNGQAVFPVNDDAQLVLPETPFRDDAYFLDWAPEKLDDISDWKDWNFDWPDEEPDAYYAVWLAGDTITLPAGISVDMLQDILNQDFVQTVRIEGYAPEPGMLSNDYAVYSDGSTLTINEDLFIPSDKTLELVDGVGMVVENDATLTNYGRVLGSSRPVRATSETLKISEGGVINFGTLELSVICDGGGLINRGNIFNSLTIQSGAVSAYDGYINSVMLAGNDEDDSYNEFDMYGGEVDSFEQSGGTFNMAGGWVDYFEQSGGTFNMYGGWVDYFEQSGGRFDMYGGEVGSFEQSDGSSYLRGGSLYSAEITDGSMYFTGAMTGSLWEEESLASGPAGRSADGEGLFVSGGYVSIRRGYIPQLTVTDGDVRVSGGMIGGRWAPAIVMSGGTVTIGDDAIVRSRSDGVINYSGGTLSFYGGTVWSTQKDGYAICNSQDARALPDVHIGGGVTFIVGRSDDDTTENTEEVPTTFDTDELKAAFEEELAGVQNGIISAINDYLDAIYDEISKVILPAAVNASVEAVNKAIEGAITEEGVLPNNFRLTKIDYRFDRDNEEGPDIFTVEYTVGGEPVSITTATTISYPEDTDDQLTASLDALTEAIYAIGKITLPEITLPDFSLEKIPANIEITGIAFDPERGMYVITYREAWPGIIYGFRNDAFPGWNRLDPRTYWQSDSPS